MADTFDIKRGDTLPKFTATLYTDEELTTVVDLSDATQAKVKVGEEGNVIIDKVATILTPATDGKVEVVFTEAETGAQTGEFKVEVEITWSDGSISTYPKTGFKDFVIWPDLDGVGS